MKKLIKTLLLGAVVIGMAVGCQNNPVSSTPSSNSSSTLTSSTSEIITSSSTTSSIISSTTSSSSSSSSTSSSSSSSSSSVAPTLTGIVLDTTNVKVNYYTGEALDLTGLVVTAQYSDNTTAPVTNYVTNPVNGTVFNTTGEQNVTVTYETVNASFKVTITKAPKTNWTDEEAAFMASKLYGEVLPYTGFEESTVNYNAQYNAVVILGGAITEEFVTAYARACLSQFIQYDF